jgi:hypothetical protein
VEGNLPGIEWTEKYFSKCSFDIDLETNKMGADMHPKMTGHIKSTFVPKNTKRKTLFLI